MVIPLRYSSAMVSMLGLVRRELTTGTISTAEGVGWSVVLHDEACSADPDGFVVDEGGGDEVHGVGDGSG